MRRTLHAVSFTVLAGSALLAFAPGAAAEPAAEVSPATVEPGGTLTISVSCDPDGGRPPSGTTDASSPAFEAGTVPLRKVTGVDDKVSGPTYRGTARIAAAEHLEDDSDAPGKDPTWSVEGTCPAAPGGKGEEWSATFTVAHAGGGHTPSHQPADEPAHEPCEPGEPDYGPRDEPADELSGGSADTPDGDPVGGAGEVPRAEVSGVPGDESAGGLSEGSADAADGDPGEEWGGESAGVEDEAAEVPAGGSWQRESACGGAVVQRGARAGDGGAFTDSVPALVAGGVLIAGAFGAAAHRLLSRGDDPYH
ncbi:hypothetical protein ABZ499_19390 [Streptomyces sp. NPDC019990]|uniref:hypothetical protein n=1 Tax=Streptomyces sp. NPDC019990 TaxID=3154693 RepID=UPI0033E45BA2